MVDVIIKKTENLRGEVCAPPSKSYTQRMLVASALSGGSSEISNPLQSEDTEATIRAITSFGANVKREENCWEIEGTTELHNAKEPIDCGESGATLRFMIPVLALAPYPSILTFKGSLERRPIKPLLKSLYDLGANAHLKKHGDKDAVLVEGGGILGGATSIPGDISSQFISGLMFACPLAKIDTEITLTSPLESTDYVKMTQEVLTSHDVRVDVYGNFERIVIPANQTFKPFNSRVPGDFSSTAFLLAAAAITNSDVTIKGLDNKSIQGDKAILVILKQMGANGKVCENSVEIKGTLNPLEPINVDAKNIPDLVPAIAALACFAKGVSRITGARRLRLKESDRLLSLHSELTKMGAQIELEEKGLTITGSSKLNGAVIDPHNDHRIAMACSVAALRADDQTTVLNAGSVRKSYPQFYTDLKQIGAEIIGGKFDR